MGSLSQDDLREWLPSHRSPKLTAALLSYWNLPRQERADLIKKRLRDKDYNSLPSQLLSVAPHRKSDLESTIADCVFISYCPFRLMNLVWAQLESFSNHSSKKRDIGFYIYFFGAEAPNFLKKLINLNHNPHGLVDYALDLIQEALAKDEHHNVEWVFREFVKRMLFKYRLNASHFSYALMGFGWLVEKYLSLKF